MTKSGDNVDGTTIKTVAFSGKQEDWEQHKTGFMAFAKGRGFAPLLTTEKLCKNLASDVEVLTGVRTVEGKEVALTEAEKRLSAAHAQGVSAILGSVFSSTNATLKSLHQQLGACDTCYEMWELLNSIYDPKELGDLGRLEEEWANCEPRADQGKHAKLFLSELDLISKKLAELGEKYKKDTLQYGTKILTLLRDEGKTSPWGTFRFIWSKQTRKFNSDQELFNKFKKQFEEEWRDVGNPALFKSGKESKAYSAGTKRDKRDIVCHNCGKKGHVQKDCRSKKTEGGSESEKDMSKVKCYKCKQNGHYAGQCPLKEKNKTTTAATATAFCAVIANVDREAQRQEDDDAAREAARRADEERNRIYREQMAARERRREERRRNGVLDWGLDAIESDDEESEGADVVNTGVGTEFVAESDFDFGERDGAVVTPGGTAWDTVSADSSLDGAEISECERAESAVLSFREAYYDGLPTLIPRREVDSDDEGDTSYEGSSRHGDDDTTWCDELPALIPRREADSVDEGDSSYEGGQDEDDGSWVSSSYTYSQDETDVSEPLYVYFEDVPLSDNDSTKGATDNETKLMPKPDVVLPVESERDAMRIEMAMTLLANKPFDESVALMATAGKQRGAKTGDGITFALDSGASNHFINSKDAITNPQPTNIRVTTADGSVSKPTVVGEVHCKTRDLGQRFILTRVYLQEEFDRNLMSLPCLVEKGFQVTKTSYSTIVLHHENSNVTLSFERDAEDDLYYLHTDKDESEESTACTARATRVMPIQEAHVILGHACEAKLRRAAKVFGWKLTGTLQLCENCQKAKGRQKDTCKVSSVQASKPGERLFADAFGPYEATPSGSRFGLMVVDQFTSRKWLYIMKRKSESAHHVETLLTWLKGRQMDCKFLRLDPAGENKAMRSVCDKYGVQMEFTPRNTPQYNGQAERAIANVKDCAYAAMMDAGCDTKWWAAACLDKTVLDNIIPRKTWANAYEPFGDSPPVKPDDLLPFGVSGMCTIKGKLKKNFDPKSEAVFRIGYADSTPSDTYTLVKKSNGQVITSRDVTFEKSCLAGVQTTAEPG